MTVCMYAHSVTSESLVTIACQTSLSMEFSRQEYWSGLIFPTTEHLPDPGVEPMSLSSAALAGGFFSPAPPVKLCERVKDRGACSTAAPCSTAPSQTWLSD